jgi:hypothetical protein
MNACGSARRSEQTSRPVASYLQLAARKLEVRTVTKTRSDWSSTTTTWKSRGQSLSGARQVGANAHNSSRRGRGRGICRRAHGPPELLLPQRRRGAALGTEVPHPAFVVIDCDGLLALGGECQ